MYEIKNFFILYNSEPQNVSFMINSEQYFFSIPLNELLANLNEFIQKGSCNCKFITITNTSIYIYITTPFVIKIKYAVNKSVIKTIVEFIEKNQPKLILDLVRPLMMKIANYTFCSCMFGTEVLCTKCNTIHIDNLGNDKEEFLNILIHICNELRDFDSDIEEVKVIRFEYNSYVFDDLFEIYSGNVTHDILFKYEDIFKLLSCKNLNLISDNELYISNFNEDTGIDETNEYEHNVSRKGSEELYGQEELIYKYKKCFTKEFKRNDIVNYLEISHRCKVEWYWFSSITLITMKNNTFYLTYEIEA